MCGSGADMGYYVWPAPRPRVDEYGRIAKVHPGRPLGSVAPADGSRFARDTRQLAASTPEEAADAIDGVVGTTLPGAAGIAATRESFEADAKAHALETLPERAAAAVALAERADAARRPALPPSLGEAFGWRAERAGHAMLTKLDGRARRHEAFTSTLLRTVRSDGAFRGGGAQLVLTPASLPRLCDRLGVALTEAQAADLFRRRGLPQSGASVQRLSASLIDAPDDAANARRTHARHLFGDAVRPKHVRDAHATERKAAAPSDSCCTIRQRQKVL